MADAKPDEILVQRSTLEKILRAAVQELIKGIPYVGGVLHTVFFPEVHELWHRRFEQTVREVLEARDGQSVVSKEEFAELVEKVGPHAARSVDEEKRRNFRDLLINAATLSGGSTEWADANMAANLMMEIEPAGLAVVAALARGKSGRLSIESTPTPGVVDGVPGTHSGDWPIPDIIPIRFRWTVVEEWVHRLHEKRVITSEARDGRGSFVGVRLTDLGQLLVTWGKQPEPPRSGPSEPSPSGNSTEAQATTA